MIDYILDSTSDIALPLTKVISASDLLFQEVALLLNTWREDFPYNIEAGMPYQDIFEKTINYTEIEKQYTRQISRLPGFSSLRNFTITKGQNRNIQISFTVVSTDGAQNDFTQVV